ncbi:MAG: hypothetical protein LUQ32_08695 [Methanomicrobiales archaeon]|nr:hypothetical protein [Methanomicrobiales archaeon]
MGTLTALILVGASHRYPDGITPSHYLFLSEKANDRPAWILVSQNILESLPHEIPPPGESITWVPTQDHMLEDAFLMIALHVIGDRELMQMAEKFCREILSPRVVLYDCVHDDQRRLLYERCRKISQWPKIILSVFKGSSVQNPLAVFQQYPMNFEVCLSGDIPKHT